ncbi:MAG TPA: type I polyketide synthase, partial [Polyangium sp.]|nr:type I polyketide synthase [Polyangium sp.]
MLPALPLLISGKTDAAIKAQALQLEQYLEGHSDISLVDCAFSLATTRTHFEVRAALVASDVASAKMALHEFALGQSSAHANSGVVKSLGKLALLFTGQGSQHAEMGHELYRQFPVFRDALDAPCAFFDRALDRPLRDVIFASAESELGALLGQTAYTQAALFSLEVALFRLFEHWGLKPDLLLGHSIGEIAAAHIAGVFSLEDACRLVAARGRLMQALPTGGGMCALQASEQEVLPLVVGKENAVSIAAINGPMSVVIAGDEDAVFVIARHFEAMGRKTKRLQVSHAFHSPLMEPMLAEFGRSIADMKLHAPTIAIISNVTGQVATTDELTSPDYWVRHVRQAVRFADCIHTAIENKATTFLEIGPHGVLSALTHELVPAESLVVPALRNDRSEITQLVHTLGALHVQGFSIDWNTFFNLRRPQFIALPTYPFQRQRYWIDPAPQPCADLTSIGLLATNHPLLTATVPMADSDEVLFNTRLSLQTHPWLAGHVVFGVVLVPATAFIEIGLTIALRLGLDGIEELTLESPMALSAREPAVLQIRVAAPDERGKRPIVFHARGETSETWTRIGFGVLGTSHHGSFMQETWPPRGAEVIDVASFYENLEALRLSYQMPFRGLQTMWKRGNDLFAEVALPADEPNLFGIHPALLDAALHPLATQLTAVCLPFSWSGIRLHSSGAQSVRVHIAALERQNAFRVQISDTLGAPIVSVQSVDVRPASPAQVENLLEPQKEPSLYRLQWIPWITHEAANLGPQSWAVVGPDELQLAAVFPVEHHPDFSSLGPAAQNILLSCVSSQTPTTLQGVHEVAHRVLGMVQSWLAEPRLSGSRLVVLTRQAVAAHAHEIILDVRYASLWGLLRSVINEHPERQCMLVDIDDHGSLTSLPSAIASGQKQIAIRRGALYIPTLVPAKGSTMPLTHAYETNGTVVITGGTGSLGAHVARHLVEKHKFKNLVLVSRHGSSAPNANALRSALERAGAHVEFVAGDVGDRKTVETLLSSIPNEMPLVGVVHTAGVLDDGIVENLDSARMTKVFRPKVDAAWHLDELTRRAGVQFFVLYSSLAGVFGGPAQGNYAAANSFLDALAHQRRAAGYAATSLAWGPLEQKDGMTASLTAADRARMSRLGIHALALDEALHIFDDAVFQNEPMLVPVRFHVSTSAAIDNAPPILRALLPKAKTRHVAPSTPARGNPSSPRAQITGTDNERALHDLVLREISVVLGVTSGKSIALQRPLQELGLDSLMAVELRNRLAKATGLVLPAT